MTSLSSGKAGTRIAYRVDVLIPRSRTNSTDADERFAAAAWAEQL